MVIVPKCPGCGKLADSRDFDEDYRMDDDLGINEYYRCNRCNQAYRAELRYTRIVKEQD